MGTRGSLAGNVGSPITHPSPLLLSPDLEHFVPSNVLTLPAFPAASEGHVTQFLAQEICWGASSGVGSSLRNRVCYLVKRDEMRLPHCLLLLSCFVQILGTVAAILQKRRKGQKNGLDSLDMTEVLNQCLQRPSLGC